MSQIIERQWNGLSIGQRKSNGYFNATQLAKAYWQTSGIRREPSEWLSNKRTKDTLAHLSKTTGYPVDKLVERYEGRKGGTYIHPGLLEDFNSWLQCEASNEQKEKTIQSQLQKALKGDREVFHPCGFIDLVTSSEIIEVKSVRQWMKRVGQLMIFGQDYPNLSKRLHLFGLVSPSKMSQIKSYCTPLSIEVTWEG